MSRLNDILMAASLRLWRKRAAGLANLDADELRRTRKMARQLRQVATRAIRESDDLLAAEYLGGHNFPVPDNCDWAWRPEVWRARVAPFGLPEVANDSTLGSELRIFHDGQGSDLIIRQTRNHLEQALAPWNLSIDAFDPQAKFVALVVDLPASAMNGLLKTHIFTAQLLAQSDYQQRMFLRLNIRHGPNDEQIIREAWTGAQEISVDFDLVGSRLQESRLERIWFEVILDVPRMNAINLRDLRLTRRARAEI